MSDLQSMGSAIGALLKERGETVAVSESSTGGIISAALLSVPGASAYFMGGGVVYTQASREALLEINLDDHPGMRSASEPYAALCAETIRARLGTVWGLAETGASGPSGNRYGDDAGHSCLAVNGPVTRVETLETGSNDRLENMWGFAAHALALFEAALRDA
jgi:nicotinamide-nucleotide amidase